MVHEPRIELGIKYKTLDIPQVYAGQARVIRFMTDVFFQQPTSTRVAIRLSRKVISRRFLDPFPGLRSWTSVAEDVEE